MKRHPSLVRLSREHHAGLVLSKRIAKCAGDTAARSHMAHIVLQHFASELLPHFEEEEREIFPILQGVDDAARARALQDHDELRRLAARIAQGDGEALKAFGLSLAAHIRFEERELFPCYEKRIDNDTHDSISSLTTKGTS